ncbi:hypothetical protein ATO7_10177 [Oceanococcus atlanticus]|uniref:DUF456 domain-containing protein n=1 Tax=Oceanococcus atlanticus TaxID=1317117 RepID=A0A1Y1SEN2_9GAMM|nr:DUF456 domain-containing protein [Oceanococcus atlanticus]ORE87401.1 hypothetical protein ATO7_10177 [Oceanococcus atlanticus]
MDIFNAELLSAILLWAGAATLITLGLIGLVFPAIPGPPLLFGGLWMAAWMEDYVHVGLWTLVILGLLTLLGVLADFVAGALGAKRFGASGLSVLGATLGAIVGIFFGLIGLLIGPFAGAVIGELMSGRTLDAAGRAGVGATIGLLIGTAAKLATGIMMVGIFLFMRLT